jgi:hypothetical protein
MYGLGPYANRAWKACDILIEFSHAGCTLIICLILVYDLL